MNQLTPKPLCDFRKIIGHIELGTKRETNVSVSAYKGVTGFWPPVWRVYTPGIGFLNTKTCGMTAFYGKTRARPGWLPKSNIPQALTTVNKQCVHRRGSLERSLKVAQIRK